MEQKKFSPRSLNRPDQQIHQTRSSMSCLMYNQIFMCMATSKKSTKKAAAKITDSGANVIATSSSVSFAMDIQTYQQMGDTSKQAELVQKEK
jgi:hypothetical protein